MKPRKFFVLLVLVFQAIYASAQTKSTTQPANKSSNQKQSAKADNCCCNTLPDTVCQRPAETVQDIILDFKTKAIVLPKDTRENRFKKSTAFRVRVLNYNPFFYNVIINNSDSSVSSPVSGGMLSTFLDPSGLAGVVTGIMSSIGIVPPTSNALAKGVYDIEDSTVIPTKFARQSLLSAKENVSFIQWQAKVFVEGRNELINKLRDSINATLFESQQGGSLLSNAIDSCGRLRTPNATLISEVENQLKRYIQQLNEQRADVSQSKFNYNFQMAEIGKPEAKERLLIARDSLLNLAYSLLLKEIDDIKAKFSYQTIAQLKNQLLIANTTTCYTSLPIFMKRDISDITIELKPRFDSTGLHGYKTSFFLPWRQRRVWGLSAGVYASSLHSNLYGVRRDSSTAGVRYNIVKENESSNVEIGANALAYTAWSISDTKPDYFGLAFGAGLSIESKPKPRIFLGVCLVNGEKNRMVYSLGFVAGYVGRLSSAFADNTLYIAEPTGFIRDVVKPGVYFSINYSFL